MKFRFLLFFYFFSNQIYSQNLSNLDKKYGFNKFKLESSIDIYKSDLKYFYTDKDVFKDGVKYYIYNKKIFQFLVLKI